MGHRAVGEKLRIEKKIAPVLVLMNSALKVDNFHFGSNLRRQFGQRRDYVFFFCHLKCVVPNMYFQEQKKKVWVFECKNVIKHSENDVLVAKFTLSAIIMCLRVC